ncbi:peptidase C39 family protein [Mycolicibacterium komossense]|uniref:Peptidase C39 family protein n=1 Tax=Mycolicibacterium komossense TaxID=1779 RepID=A0ABT3CCZ2_9MYCO|nr:peptidase C39 family protein [Mycolicibacterium komossense]MCV7227116.1 peptidase C39 family protein [Mycolicibacterium komossense]
MTQLQQSITVGADAIGQLLGAGLGETLGPERVSRWEVNREPYRPCVVTLSHDDATVAAALVTGRPATAACKIVDLWCDDDGVAGAALLDAVVELARTQAAVVAKWEVPAGAELPPFALTRGFVPMRPPTSARGSESVRGYALWLESVPHPEARYYAQTTDFTCGAVAALLAAELAGRPGFAGDHTDRRLEIDFWRGASNFPACEPIGLAVALQRHVGAERVVEVTLNSDNPVLVEDFVGFEREFRLELQSDSMRHAAELQIPLREDRIEVAEIAARIAGGEVALLLITQIPMHGQNEPHWITAHASDGHSVVIVQDPWIDTPAGETWVDSHDLPVRLADLGSMCSWGADGYRGVVFLTR